MKKIAIMGLVSALAVASQAGPITSFVNAGFDDGDVTTGGFTGFDAPSTTEIIGWSNYPTGPLNDAGVQGTNAWWGTYEVNSAFMRTDDAAYNMSSYVIQAGDEFTIGFVGKAWTWEGPAEWTVSLFYDDPANVIGTYVTALTDAWTAYSNPTAIEATAGSIGGTLGILFENTGTAAANLDSVSVDVIPEPATIGLIGIFGAGVLFVRRRFMI